jgi:ABC-2 type transport system permease protein
MSKLWLIASHHFLREVRKKTFLLVLFSMPLFVAFVIGFGYIVAQIEEDNTTVGYVDHAGLLADLEAVPPRDDVVLQRFDSAESAQQALDDEQIQLFYVISADYATSGSAELVFYDPDYSAFNYFDRLVRANVLLQSDPAALERFLDGVDVTIYDTSTGRDYANGGPEIGMFLPLVVGIIFAFLTLTTSGYMMNAVVEEKENRTMEIIITSTSPNQMMAGKVIGALLIGLTQLLVWTVFILLAIWIGQNVLDLAWLQNIEPVWRDFGMIIIVALSSYLFIAAFMTLIGTTLVESQEAQQAGGLVFLPMFVPIYLIVPIVENPDGPLAVTLSLIPFTSVITLALRSLTYVVPLWQIGLAALIGLGGGILLMWMAGRALRLSMLRYGKRVRLGEIFGRKEKDSAETVTV